MLLTNGFLLGDVHPEHPLKYDDIYSTETFTSSRFCAIEKYSLVI